MTDMIESQSHDIPPAHAEYYQRRQIWAAKPHIRLVYQRWIERMKPFLPAGPLLEVGSGSGLLKHFFPDVILSDVVPLPWIDRVLDGKRLPFEDGALGGVLLFDTLHHVADPHQFLAEAARVLRPGGRILMIEPYITAGSYPGYKLLHHELVYLKDYYPSHPASDKNPWDSNLAMANLVFGRDLPDWPRLHPDLSIIHQSKFSLLDFQLALGFKPRALVPYGLFKWLVRIDDLLLPLMPLLAYRIFVVVEKSPQ